LAPVGVPAIEHVDCIQSNLTAGDLITRTRGGKNKTRIPGRIATGYLSDLENLEKLSVSGLVVVVISAHVSHGAFIAAPESVAIVVTQIAGNMGMTVRVVIVGIGPAMMFEVVASGFDSVVKALALSISELIRRRIPLAILCC
jgi:hypothetical protein